MARAVHRLTARGILALKAPGRHADGGGLYLRITPKGARSWVFMTTLKAKRLEIGLGAASSVPLATARTIAASMRESVALGQDPRACHPKAIAAIAKPSVPTFGEFADDYILKKEAGWKSPVHRQQWRNTLRDYASSIRDKPINDVKTDDIVAILRPIWLEKPETAKRLMGRIQKIIAAAIASGVCPEDMKNPARFAHHLQELLPKRDTSVQRHHKALAWKEAPAFMRELRARPAIAALCLQFVILTAARSGEALGATWGEIDFERREWSVPRARMKARNIHIVPLSDDALTLLSLVKPSEPRASELVFAVKGAARSNMAMAMLLRRMGKDITTHGFRSTFSDWAGDGTEYAPALVEHSLGHAIKSKAEAAYRRETAIDRRRALMADWANYLDGRPVSLPAKT